MVGSDADLAIVDTNRPWVVDDATIQSRSKISPWHGMQATALPIHTIVRGRFAMKDRQLQEDTRGWGRSVHTIQQMPPVEIRNADQTMAAVTSQKEKSAA
ncbi:dihydroorotase [compost metagenome]